VDRARGLKALARELRAELLRDGRVAGRHFGQTPPMREELVEPVLRPAGRELGEHVRKVRQRWNPVLGAGACEAVEVCCPSRRFVRACEQVVLAAECDVPELLFTQRMPRAGLCRVGVTSRLQSLWLVSLPSD
jgi:hypothetical protein